MPVEEPIGPPENLRSCSTVVIRCAGVPCRQFVQSAIRSDSPTPSVGTLAGRVFARPVTARELARLDAPQPASSAAAQISPRMRDDGAARGFLLRVSRAW